MAAAGRAAQQVDQIVALTVDALLRIDAVIGNNYECCFVRQRTLLNGCPDPAKGGIELLQREELRFGIIVMVRAVIEIRLLYL
jgi:hypothetical protein